MLNVIDLMTKDTASIRHASFFTARIHPAQVRCIWARNLPERFAALVISSGPIVFDSYPFDRLKGKVRLMVIHGDQDTTNPIEASKQMADAARAAGVDDDLCDGARWHASRCVSDYAREIFDFLDEKRPIPLSFPCASLRQGLHWIWRRWCIRTLCWCEAMQEQEARKLVGTASRSIRSRWSLRQTQLSWSSSRDIPAWATNAYIERRRTCSPSAAGIGSSGSARPSSNTPAKRRASGARSARSSTSCTCEHACQIYLRGEARARASRRDEIPQLRTLSERLERETNMHLVPAEGALPYRTFYEYIAERGFPVTQFIRHGSHPEFTPEPDMIHDCLGHVPPLMNQRLRRVARR